MYLERPLTFQTLSVFARKSRYLGSWDGAAGWASDSCFWFRSGSQGHGIEPGVKLWVGLGAGLGFFLSPSAPPKINTTSTI